ncbi:MAG: nucleoside deaminase [Anaerolineae bacterium]|nr:nucleoside deaminase [Anaerolineae bacterium]
MTDSDEYFLRRAIALAQFARQQEADPFGAVLVVESKIVHEAYDHSVVSSDPTWHAELSVISEYCRIHQRFSLQGFTLYSSTEPCMMCTGAIHWSRISRVVFSVSQQMLQERSEGRPKPTCESLLNRDGQRVEVIGPILAEEGLAVFTGYEFVPKVERHRIRFVTQLLAEIEADDKANDTPNE